jgi:predicted GIY-YIG superfamily endonuclease
MREVRMSYLKDMRFLDDPCYVYVLVNPIDKKPFYIGISNNPWDRFRAHSKECWSAAWRPLKSLLQVFCRDEILKIYKKCPTRAEAFELEYRLVTSTPGLLNRPYKRGRGYV